MNFFNKILKPLLYIIGFVIAAATFYFQIVYTPKTIINIEKANEVQLTQPLKIDGLKVSYTFNDTIEVKNLWQTTFVLRNNGDKTIYGEGFEEKSIRNNFIPFEIEECNSLLSATITNQNCNAFIMSESKIVITQWRPQEYIEIKVISEGDNSPKLKLSDREIKDSEITYSIYSPEGKEAKLKYIDYLPKGLADTLKWIITSVMAILFLAATFSISSQVKSASKGQKVITIILWIIFMVFIFCPLLWMF